MRKTAIITVGIFIFALCLQSEASIIWSDGFESGNFSAWNSANGNWAIVTSTLSAYSGNKGADIKGATDVNGDILSVNIPSSGFQNIQWQYWYKVRDGLEGTDLVSAEWTQNGSNWTPLDKYFNIAAGDWQFASFTLPVQANENPNLGFRLIAELNGITDRMNFDDFALLGESVPEPATFLIFLFSFSCIAARRKH